MAKPTQEQMEMAFMQDDAVLADDGMNKDPVSGNDIPSGSMAEEVRDDVPAMLSEGEYVVPADVVRFHGIQKFEELRDEAKMGLARMEQDGRIGGAPVEDQDELPFSLEELETTTAYRGGLMGFAEGGDTGSFEDAFGQSYTANQRYGSVGSGSSQLGFQLRNFTSSKTGKTITIPFYNGKPMQYIPPEYGASDTAGSGGGGATDTAADERDRQADEAERARTTGTTGSAFDLPSAFDDMEETPKTFAEFTPEDWQNYVNQADSTLADITAKVPVLGSLQRMSESAARSYADKALRSGKNPATGESLTSQETLALQQVLTVAKNTGLVESISSYFTGKKGETTGVPLYDQANFKEGLLPKLPEGMASTKQEGPFYKAGETDGSVEVSTLESSGMEEAQETLAEKNARILDESKPKSETIKYETITPENYTSLVKQDKDGFFSMKADAAESPFFTPVNKPTFNITKEDKDLWVKTILGEADSDLEDRLAVAHVIKNRMQDGRFFRTWSDKEKSMGEWNGQTIKAVVTSTGEKGYGQFSTWNNIEKGGNDPNRFSPKSKAYKEVAKIIDGIMYGDPNYVDNTNNSIYYLNKDKVSSKRLSDPEFWYNKEKENWGELDIGRHTFTGKKRGAGAPETVKTPLARPSDMDLTETQMQDIVSTEKTSSKPESFSEEVLNLDEIYAPVLGEPSERDDTTIMSIPTMSAQDWVERDNKVSGLSIPQTEPPKDFTGQTTPPTRVTLPEYTPPTTDALAEKTQVKREDIPSLMPEQPSISVTEPTIGQPKAESGKLPQTDMPQGFLNYEPPTTGKRKVTDAKAFLEQRDAAKKAVEDALKFKPSESEPKKKKEEPKTEKRKVPGVSIDKAREASQDVFMSTGDAFAADRAYHEAFTGFTADGELSPTYGFKEGGLASKLKKTKSKKRNTKKGLGGKMAT